MGVAMADLQKIGVFKTLSDIAMALKQDPKSSPQITHVQWTSQKQEGNSTRLASDDPWASQVASYLHRRADAGNLFFATSQRAAGRED